MKRFSFLAWLLILGSVALVAADEQWPREIETAKGLVVLYQPQVDTLEGDILSGRSAVSIKPDGQDEPIFGAAWLEGRIETDYDARTATFIEIRVSRVRFQDATDEQQQELADLLSSEIPTWDVELSLDELMASLEIAELGNVFRQQSDGKWQQRDGGQWSKADVGQQAQSRADTAAGQRGGAGAEGGRLSGGNLEGNQGRAAGAEAARSGRNQGSTPSAGSRSSSPPRSSGGSSVSRSQQSRQRGSQRTRSAPRGGGRRGGGGRR